MNKKISALFTLCFILLIITTPVFAAVNPVNGDLTPQQVKAIVSKIELKDATGQYRTIFSGSQTIDFASANNLPLDQPNVPAGSYLAVRVTQSRNITYYFSHVDDTTANGPWYSKSTGPNGSVYASKVGPAVAVTSRLNNPNGSQDITVGSTTIHLVLSDNDFTYEIPLPAPITVTANGNSDIHFKFQLTNMMFVETYDTSSGLGVVSSNPPLLMN